MFEAELLPDFAKTYILPRKMTRRPDYKEEDDVYRKQNVAGTLSRKQSTADVTETSRKQDGVKTDFQFSMLKASLDYDTELFGGESVPRHLSIASRHNSIIEGTDSRTKERRKKSMVPCNSPGKMFDYAKYIQDGGYVPESVRNAEVGLELEVFASNPSDITDRMKEFSEVHFFDGSLNTQLSLQQAHTNMAVMLQNVEKSADTTRNLPGSSLAPVAMAAGYSRVDFRAARAAKRRGLRAQSSLTSVTETESAVNGSTDHSSATEIVLEETVVETPATVDTPDTNVDIMEMMLDCMFDDSMGKTRFKSTFSKKKDYKAQGSEAVGIFIDQTNPYNKTVHVALPTTVKEMERRQKYIGQYSI